MANKVVVKGKNGEYAVTQLVGKTPDYNVYFCTSESRPGEMLFLKIAATKELNGLLDREAYLLRTLREDAEDLEAKHAASGGEHRLDYQFYFPNVVDSFVAAESNGFRRVMITRFEVVPDLSEFVPLLHVRERDRVRVDPKTGAWILGKTLRALAFVHDQKVSIGNLSGSNILIVRGDHLVGLFDWSKASFHKEAVPSDVVRSEIAAVAYEVILSLGGNPRTGELPDDDQLSDERYAEHLFQLARGGRSDAHQAHKEFYALIRALWGREFHPYTWYPL